MNSNKPNYYDVLGIEKTANDADIKRAYRALSLKYHPDRNASAESTAKFQEVSEAYETLSDAEKKQEYDDILAGRRNPHIIDLDESDIQNIFGMMFGGGPPGINIFHAAGPGFHAFSGGGGAGIFPGLDPREHIFRQMQRPPAIFKTVEITLQQAYNGGIIPVEIQKWKLEGGVKTNHNEIVHVSIPVGVDHNEGIVLQGIGNETPDMKGDVKFIFSIQPDTVGPYIRNGIDIEYRKKITLKESLCGFSFEIRHLNGKQLLFNNKTSRTIVYPGYKKVIPNMGMIRDGLHGALHVVFDIEFPESLTNEQIETLSNTL